MIQLMKHVKLAIILNCLIGFSVSYAQSNLKIPKSMIQSRASGTQKPTTCILLYHPARVNATAV